MDYIFSKKEVKVLEHLADGKQHDEAPADLTDAQFYYALKLLKDKDLVYASFLAGGEVCSSQIKTEGRAALENFKMKEKRIIRRALKELGLTHEQYQILNNARKMSIEENCNNQKTIISLSREGYLKKNVFSNCNRHWIITEEGEDVLDEIEDRLYDNSVNDSLHVESSNKRDYPVKSFEQPEKTVEKHGDIRIAEKHITDSMKIFYAMWKLGYFEENGEPPTIKSVMDTVGNLFHAKQFSQYSSYLNSANKAKENTVLQPFYDLEEIAREFHKDMENRENNRN